MRFWKKILKKAWDRLKQPPAWVQLLVYASALTFFLLAILAVAFGKGGSTLALFTYVAFAFVFVYAVYITVVDFKKVKKRVLVVADKYTFTRNLHENYVFRTVFFSACSLVFNIGYAVWLGVTALVSRSLVYLALAGYYIFLSATRGCVLIKSHNNEKKYKNDFFKLHRANVISYIVCGAMLLALTLLLGVTVVLTVRANDRIQYAKVMIFAAAIFAFYKIGTSIANVIKAKKHEDEVVRAVRYTNFATALVSLFTLQISMLDAFAKSTEVTVVPNVVTGTAVSVMIIMLGVRMIMSGIKDLRALPIVGGKSTVEEKLEKGYNRADYCEEYGQVCDEQEYSVADHVNFSAEETDIKSNQQGE